MRTDPGPSGDFRAVTTSDTVNLSTINNRLPRALFVGGAGNLVAVGGDDQPVTFTGVTAGQILTIRVRRVNATLTTATSIVALY